MGNLTRGAPVALARGSAERSRVLPSLVGAIGLGLVSVALIPVFAGGRVPLLFGVMAGGMAVAGLVFWPHLGVLTILSLWLIEAAPLLPGLGMVSLPKAVSAILLVPLAVAMFKDRSLWVVRLRPIRLLALIGAVLVLSSWWNESTSTPTALNKLDETSRMLQEFFTHFVLMVFFAHFINSRRRIESVVWLVIGISAVAVVGALPAGLAGHRAEATFGAGENANRLAFISLFSMSLVWCWRSRRKGGLARRLTLPLLGLFPIAAMATGSRSGMLQLPILAVLLLAEQKQWSIGKRIRSGLLLAMLGGLVMLMVPAVHLIRATSYSSATEARGGESLKHRIDRVVVGVRMIVDHPILGIGIGNYGWMKHTQYGSSTPGNTHNSYLWAATGAGIGAVILYLLLFRETYRMLRHLERDGPPDLRWLSTALRINLVLLLVFSAFADFWLSDYTYLIIGLAVSIGIVHRDRSRVSLASTPMAWNSSRPLAPSRS